ncbi:hypothetical protein IHE44_0000197 [Lamprotornis superbus]|uniref:COMM domain-containing protein 3 n=1 Tax=Lamprotornis superbus TaxID=245042 RepID=A0A835P3V4_9PASS|nr:hypothetical protein IHE44_0000197 [Lamprotornis superbus]
MHDPDLKDIDPTVLKHCHAAAATCILEAGKQKADISAISTCLEDCKLDKERIEQFCTEYQKNKDALEILLGSIGRSPLHITDVSWRLEYQIKFIHACCAISMDELAVPKSKMLNVRSAQ